MRFSYLLPFLTVAAATTTTAAFQLPNVHVWTTTPTLWKGPRFPFDESPTALWYANEPIETSTNMVGQVVMNGKYLLTGYIPVASLKCDIYKAYPLTASGQVQKSIPLIVKYSNTGVDREYVNYQQVFSQLRPDQHDLFVQVHDKIPASVGSVYASAITSSSPAGIVMERGKDNLRMYIRNHGAYRGDALRQAFFNVIAAVHALHSNGWIWTELKPENFVVTAQAIKGIDLESLVRTNALLQVYTAEACPPEFPIDDMYKTLPVMTVGESFDVWGLGLVLFEMATGKPFYAGGLTDLKFIQDQLRNVDQTLQEAQSKLQHIDPQAAAIITACLNKNPSSRPSCQQLLQHPYFTQPKSGISSFYETHSSASANFGMPTSVAATFQARQPIVSTPTQGRPRRSISLQPQAQRPLHSELSPSQKIEKSKDKELCWRTQLTQVLESLAAYAQEDPEMAQDLQSILDQAKHKLVGFGGLAMR